MPVYDIQEVLFGIEANEGTAVALAGTDALEIYDPQISHSIAINPRRPAGSSLSRAITPPGRESRSLTFGSDLTASGAVGTVPPWSKPLRCCAYHEVDKHKLTMSGISGGIFQAAEKVQITGDGTRWGILFAELLDTDKLHVAWLAGAAPSAAETIDGTESGATGTVSAVTVEGKYYRPTAKRLIQVSIDSWVGTPPVVGEALTVRSNVVGAPVLGALQLIEFTTGTTDFKAVLVWGTCGNLNTLHTEAGASAAVDAAVTQIEGLSATIRHNLDGFYQELLGSRGTASLSGSVGEALRWAWNFLGQVGNHGDALLTGGAPTQLTDPPRMLGARIVIGAGSSSYPFPIQSISTDLANTVNMRGNANAPGGDIGAFVADRDPKVTVTTELVPKGHFDWIGKLRSATPVRFATRLGTTAGGRVAIACNKSQIEAVPIQNVDGYANVAAQLAPRRLTTGGDNEILLAQL